MALQDIKYVMSVDDKSAQQAIQRTVSGLKTLDRSKFGDGNANHLVSAIESAGEKATTVFEEMGNSLGAIFGGTALGNAIANAVSKSMAQVSGIASNALAGIGLVGGAAMGKKLVASFSGEFTKMTAMAEHLRAAFASILAPLREGILQFRLWTAAMARLHAKGLIPEIPKISGISTMFSWVPELRKALGELGHDLGLLGREWAATAASGLRSAFARSRVVIGDLAGDVADLGRAFLKLPQRAKAGMQAIAAQIKNVAGGFAFAFEDGMTSLVGRFALAGERMVGALRNPLKTMKGLGASLSTAITGAFTNISGTVSNAWAAVRGVSLTAVAGITAAVVLGVAAIGGAFFAVAHHADAAWSEVEDGVMTVQATLVGFGKSVEEAFSDKVTDSIMQTADRMALAFGTMPKDVAAATSVLTKNGVELDAALARMSMVANIAKVNNISMSEAAEKVVAAWNGEAKALKEIGIRIDDTGDAAKNAELLMKKLQDRYSNPALGKPFIDDSPIKVASAAVNTLWVNLGKALDPAMTAAAQALADVITGIAESLKDSSNADFLPNVEGVLAAIGATTQVVVNAAIVVGNVFQILWTGIKSLGQSIWYGVQYAWAWLQDKLSYMLQWIGEAIDYIPGTGDAGKNLQNVAAGMKSSATQAMQESGKAFADAAQANSDALARDMKDIMNAVAPDGGAVGALQRKGQAAREKAQKEAADQAKNAPALGESEKVKEDRENKAKQEAEKRAKEEKQTFLQNQKIEEERAKANNQRISITLNTPQRMVPALRHGKKA